MIGQYIIEIGDEYESKNWDAIFPNLISLSVVNCEQLEYMIGQYPLDNENHKEIHLHFPTLEELYLKDLPNFISICASKNTCTLPVLNRQKVRECKEMSNPLSSQPCFPKLTTLIFPTWSFYSLMEPLNYYSLMRQERPKLSFQN